MEAVIQAQVDYIKEMNGVKQMKKALMKRLFFQHEGYFIKRKVFAHCKAKFERARRIRRLERAVSLA